MTEQLHSSMMYLPAAEIDRRILVSADGLREESNGAMKNLVDMLGEVKSNLTLLLGSGNNPGTLQRLEAKVDVVMAKQTAKEDRDAQREVVDDNRWNELRREVSSLRSDVTIVQGKVAILEIFITLGKMFWGLFAKDDEGKRPRGLFAMVSAILALISYIASVVTVHTVWPMIRESLKHHHFMP